MAWRAVKARYLLRVLQKIGWHIIRQRGSHKILSRSGWADITFAFHENEEIGPRMLSKIAKITGLKEGDL